MTLGIDPAHARVVFWIAVACCAVAQLLIVRGAWRTPRDTSPSPDGIPRPGRASEVAWTIVPGIALAVVLVLTWRALPGREARAASIDAPFAAAVQPPRAK